MSILLWQLYLKIYSLRNYIHNRISGMLFLDQSLILIQLTSLKKRTFASRKFRDGLECNGTKISFSTIKCSLDAAKRNPGYVSFFP